jgi:hypothetical protein
VLAADGPNAQSSGDDQRQELSRWRDRGVVALFVHLNPDLGDGSAMA